MAYLLECQMAPFGIIKLVNAGVHNYDFT